MEHVSLHGYIRNTPSETSAGRTPAERGQEYLTSGKEYTEPGKSWWDEGTRAKNRSVSRTRTALSGWGNWRRGPSPHMGQLSESEQQHWRLRGKRLIYGSLNGMRIRQSLLQPYIPQTGTQLPWKAQGLGAGAQGLWSNPRARAAVDCGERDQGDVREETVVGSQAAMEARQCCWVTCRGWSHHRSLSLPTCQQQLNKTEAGPSNPWGTELWSRTPPGCPVECLAHLSTEQDPNQGAPLCAWLTKQQRKAPGKGAL